MTDAKRINALYAAICSRDEDVESLDSQISELQELITIRAHQQAEIQQMRRKQIIALGKALVDHRCEYGEYWRRDYDQHGFEFSRAMAYRYIQCAEGPEWCYDPRITEWCAKVSAHMEFIAEDDRKYDEMRDRAQQLQEYRTSADYVDRRKKNAERRAVQNSIVYPASPREPETVSPYETPALIQAYTDLEAVIDELGEWEYSEVRAACANVNLAIATLRTIVKQAERAANK